MYTNRLRDLREDRDLKQKDLAEEFINFMCREDIAAMNLEYINYLTPQTQVFDSLPEDIKAERYPSDDVISRCNVYFDLKDTATLYDTLWTKIIVG